MIDKVYIFRLNLDWNLLRVVSKIDRFDASWSSIEKREGQSLKHLKNIATVRLKRAQLTKPPSSADKPF
jgi:hypothetical protein